MRAASNSRSTRQNHGDNSDDDDNEKEEKSESDSAHTKDGDIFSKDCGDAMLITAMTRRRMVTVIQEATMVKTI